MRYILCAQEKGHEIIAYKANIIYDESRYLKIGR